MPNSWTEIDLNAVRHNVGLLKSRVKPWVEVIAVVKGNAYGHGAVEVSRACLEAGVARLGVAFVSEAIELREAGITAPIMVLGTFDGDDIESILDHDLIASLWDLAPAQDLNRSARSRGQRVRVHLNVDTGMNRLGFPCEGMDRLVKSFAGMNGLIIEGIFSHFSSADEPDGAFNRVQVRRFDRAVEDLANRGLRIPVVHLQNSAGLLYFDYPKASAVRPGLALYGLSPSRLTSKPADLRPALSFRSRVVQVREVPAGCFVSYSRTYRTPQETRLATLSVGYADGFPRVLSDRAQVLIQGEAYRVVGRVTMDHIIVDLGLESSVQAGDVATLIGRDGELVITADHVADWAGTISYEIVSGISRRVSRQYMGKTLAMPEAAEVAGHVGSAGFAGRAGHGEFAEAAEGTSRLLKVIRGGR